MLNRLKVLGPVLVVVCAMSAMGASAAQAGEVELVGGATEATITGEQVAGQVTGVENTGKVELQTDAGTIKCTPLTFHGVAKSATPKELTLRATIGNTTAGTGCTMAGVAGTIVHVNGCSNEFTLQMGAPPIGVIGHFVCPPGKVVETTAGLCTGTGAGGQTFAASMVTVSNSGGAGTAMDINMVLDVAGINYVEHGTCPNCGGGTTTKTNGTIMGVVTLKGEKVGGGGSAIGVTIK